MGSTIGYFYYRFLIELNPFKDGKYKIQAQKDPN